MKYLTDRKVIAKAINIDRIPVITMDITKEMDGFEGCYKGTKIKIDGCYSGRYSDMLVECTAEMFGDKKGNEEHDMPWTYDNISLMPRNIFLDNSFSLRDVDEMVEWSNAPTVKKGDKVIVFFRGKDKGFLRMFRIPERVSTSCYPACTLEPIE